MTTPHTCDQLVQDLRALGVEAGDVLFVHASFKSLGPVEGGAATVIEALQEAIGTEGLLLLPSFNLVAMRAATWDIDTTPSNVGWISEFFRRMPGTMRSDHYSHSVAARGKGAAAFVADHLAKEGIPSPWDLEPWGFTYGTHSPMSRALQHGGKILMLGTDYESSTYAHVVEVILWNRRREHDPAAAYQAFDRPALGLFWDHTDHLQTGFTGDAECRLFPIADFVTTLLNEVERDVKPYLHKENS